MNKTKNASMPQLLSVVEGGRLLPHYKALLEPVVQTIQLGTFLVALPTETVYGLGASVTHPNTCKKIFEAKGRPSDNPLIVHISSYAMLGQLIHPQDYLILTQFLERDARPSSVKNHELWDMSRLMKTCWPGPLTLLFRKSDFVSEVITGGRDTVAIRMPNHPVMSYCIEASQCPIAAPSANLSGRPSPTTAAHVYQDFQDSSLIKYIVDGGSCPSGLESTVLNLLGDPYVMLRPGSLTLEYLNSLTSQPLALCASHDIALAPGMKYRHYSPKTPFLLFSDLESLKFYIRSHPHKKIGVLDTHQTDYGPSCIVYKLVRHPFATEESMYEEIASRLFDGMRNLDTLEIDEMVMCRLNPIHHGLGIMNRVEKASIGK